MVGMDCQRGAGTPCEQGQEGQQHHDGHKHARDAIGERLDGRFGHLRAFHEPDDLRKQAPLPDACCTHPQGAAAVDGAAQHHVTNHLR